MQDSRCGAVDVMGTWRGYLWPGLLHRANPAPYSCRRAKRKRLKAFCKGLAELAVPLSQKLCLNCELSQADKLLPFNSGQAEPIPVIWVLGRGRNQNK